MKKLVAFALVITGCIQQPTQPSQTQIHTERALGRLDSSEEHMDKAIGHVDNGLKILKDAK